MVICGEVVVAGNDRERPRSLVLFGKEVKRLRAAAGISQEQLGAKTILSGSAVGKIERGEQRCEKRWAEQADEVLDGRGALPSLWGGLVMNAAFPTWFDWPKIESEADELSTYQCLVVYGLLQTEGYARALLESRWGAEAVTARMSRQEILTRDDPPPPRLTVLLAEAVLHHQVGDRETMAEQLEYLISVRRPGLSIQVVPGPLHPWGSNGSFVIATLSDLRQLVHVSGATRGWTLNEPEDIRLARAAFDELRAAALPVEMSRDLIRKILEERWT